MNGSFEAELSAHQIKMELRGAKDIDWFFDLNAAEKAVLPFDKIDTNTIDCSFEGMKYSLIANSGVFSKPGNGSVLRISPRLNAIILNFTDF